MDPAIPLVVSQVNPDDLEGHPGIIANPNCSTMQLAPVLMAIRDAVGLERVVVDTYQAVSGTGADAIAEFEGQVRAHVAGEPKQASGLPPSDRLQRAAPGRRFLDNGYTKEEWKVVTESRKILHLPDLRISCTAVRIPVFVAHSEAVHVETREPITPDRARELFAAVPGVVVQDDPSTSTTRSRPTPPGPTRSSSAASGATRRSRMAAASRSGSSATTSARARRRTRSRSPRCSSPAAGSARPPPAAPRRPGRRSGSPRRPEGRRDPRRAPGGARRRRGPGPRLHPLPPP